MTEENRPDPGLLLKKLQYEEKEKEKQTKGKLKIFLGYAAGSGKTYACWKLPMRQKASGGCSGRLYRTARTSGYTGNGRGVGRNSAPYGRIIKESSFGSLIWMRRWSENLKLILVD